MVTMSISSNLNLQIEPSQLLWDAVHSHLKQCLFFFKLGQQKELFSATGSSSQPAQEIQQLDFIVVSDNPNYHAMFLPESNRGDVSEQRKQDSDTEISTTGGDPRSSPNMSTNNGKNLLPRKQNDPPS